MDYGCPTCEKSFQHRRSLDRLIKEKHSEGSTYSCDRCSYTAERKSSLDQHLATQHIDPEEALVKKYWHLIKTHSHRTTKIQDKFNINLEDKTMAEAMEEICHQQKNKFKVNVAFGFILRHKTTEQLTYYYASKNTQAFDYPVFIGNGQDLATMTHRLNNIDPLEYAQLRRPDTGYFVQSVTNALFCITKIRNHPIGNPAADEYEEYLLKSRSVYALTCDHEGRRYSDNLCLFRCLALASGYKNGEMEQEAKRLSRMWKSGKCSGVTMDDLDRIEELYDIKIFVYTLVNNEEEWYNNELLEPEDMDLPLLSEQIIRRPLRQVGQTIYLNMNKNHLSLIKNISSFIRSWKCCKCNKLFNHLGHLTRHERVCDDLVQYVYPGGGHGLPMNIFEKLKDEGILIEDRFYPYRAAYDFEARFTPMDKGTKKLEYTSELTPVSFSIATNIPGNSPVSGRPYTELYCVIGQPEALAEKLYTYVLDAGSASYDLMKKKYSKIIDFIESKQEDTKNLKCLMTKMREENAPTQDILKVKLAQSGARKWDFIKVKFNSWLRQLRVIRFNSEKFDMNLIRRYLVPYFTKNGIEPQVIKKTGAYMAISTKDAIFLDVTNYLAAGTSYDKWLKAFEIKESKGHFPYEWLTSITKLDQDHLPAHEEFYSTLMQKNITPEEYEQAQDIWRKEKFTTMRDYLIWYNNRDVQPFLEALERMTAFWRTLDIDMLKSGAISLPGLAYLHMFKTTDQSTIFPLFGDKGWHEKIRDNIVGGPNIIFNRHKEVGSSTIRGGRPVSNIVGYDANSLYLWCIGQDMPTGHYGIWNPTEGRESREVPVNPTDISTTETETNIRHNLDSSFKRKRGLESTFEEYVWVEWMRQTFCQQEGKNLSLRHHVYGNQKTFNIDGSRLPVDEYIPELGIILQYHGCFFHGHSCQTNRNPLLMQTRKDRTQMVRQKLQSTGLTMIEIYACEFNKDIKKNPALKTFYESKCLPLQTDLNAHQIVKAVKSGTFFGVIECDLQVPWWIPRLRERFLEMTPIFKNVEVSLDDISSHMRAFAKPQGLLNQPRKSLIGSFHAKKIVLTTPLVKWYLDQGLVITRLYSALQYQPQAAFRHLMDEVANHRRAADQDLGKKILGELFKLIGKCITDQKKHMVVKFADDKDASQYVNDKMFKTMEEVDDNRYEIFMAKKNITFNLPIMVAFFVYNYAKLKMLDFYYGFIDKYIDRRDFECMSMDTDSLYMAISGPDLPSIVKPHMREEYALEMPEYLATTPYSNRTPSLFKLEYEGIGMIALNSKTYCIWTRDGGEKLYCKGISKRTNDLKPAQFRSVLETSESVAGVNYGFRMIDGKILQYQQTRNGLVYLYIKRRVLSDGVTTVPLYI